jgi:hypothetical protein
MKLTDVPVKEVIAIGAVMVTLTGFYFSTGYRLDLLEAQAADIDANVEQLRELREQSITLNGRLERIDEKLDEVRFKIDKLEQTLIERSKEN